MGYTVHRALTLSGSEVAQLQFSIRALREIVCIFNHSIRSPYALCPMHRETIKNPRQTVALIARSVLLADFIPDQTDYGRMLRGLPISL